MSSLDTNLTSDPLDNPESPEAKALAQALANNKQNIQVFSNEINDLKSSLSQSLKDSKKNVNNKNIPEVNKLEEEKAAVAAQVENQKNNQIVQSDSIIFNKDTRSFFRKHDVNLAFMSRNVEASYLIKAQNNFNFLGFNYRFVNALDYANTSKVVLNVSYKKFLNINKGEFSVPNYMGGGVAYLGEPKFLPFDFTIGLFFENQFFINMTEYNTGLKVADSKLLWINLTIERVFYIGKLEFIAKLLYGQNIFSRTNFFSESVLNITGTKYGLGLDVLYRRFRLGGTYTIDDFSSDSYNNFSMNQRTAEISLSYLF